MINKNKLDLIYFKMQAFAEPAQLLLSYSGIQYQYSMVWDYFKKPWSEIKEEIAFGQLPLLVVDDNIHIWQSGSIVRYIASLSGQRPKDEELLARVDALFESSQELFQPLNMTINFLSGDAFDRNRKIILDNFIPKLDYYTRIIAESKGPFFFGELPFYCDFGIYHQFSMLRLLDGDVFKDAPLISNFLEAVESLSAVKSYLESRPKLIGVSEDPRLMINGKSVKTGILEE